MTGIQNTGVGSVVFGLFHFIYLCIFPMDTLNLSQVLFLDLILDLRGCGSQGEEALI